MRRINRRRLAPLCFFAILGGPALAWAWGADEPAGRTLRAGAASVDISPASFPVLVNGGFLQARATKVNDPLFARCLVLEEGPTRLAIVVVDSCMMPRELIDAAKAEAGRKTGIPADRMLVSATHTHTAPAAMGALGCPADPAYVKFLPSKIAEAIARAAESVVPARAGWAGVDDDKHTFCRRWVRRPDRMIEDPFGRKTGRANMHPGHVSPDAIAPSGPVDPALTVLSVQSAQGRPIAVLANYSMHYFGSSPVSADYFGRFAASLAKKLPAAEGGPPPVVMMSQGTSGDQMWMDYGRPRNDPGLDRYAEEVAAVAYDAYSKIEHREGVTLAMAEATLTLDRRTPDASRLEWAGKIVESMGDRVPKSLPEVYAKEAYHLRDEPRRELKLQAIRVGDLGITAIPDEVFALTGLKLKARSPLPLTMNVELANGSEGYIPPPEQHALGGYTTWPARTAALEVQAEPKIVEAVLGLLERVSGRPRREDRSPRPPYATHVVASRPAAYWRLEEMDGRLARDFTGLERHGLFHDGFALYLPGPDAPGLGGGPGRPMNRATHLAGGRITADLPVPPEHHSAEFWFWNGLPNDARPVTAFLMASGDSPANAVALGLTGTEGKPGPGLLFLSSGGEGAPIVGKTVIEPKTWHHLALVRTGRTATLYLDGRRELEGTLGTALGAPAPDPVPFSFGGLADHPAGLEGKIDEVAVYGRPLEASEIAEHRAAAVELTVRARRPRGGRGGQARTAPAR